MNVAIPVQFLNTNPNSKATFRPGGDAQYVSYVVQGIANSIADENHGDEDFESYYRALITAEASNFDFSEALKVKFINAASRLIDRELDRIAKKIMREARKAAKASLELRAMEGHLYKIGRWTYAVAEGFKGDKFVGYYREDKKSGDFIPAEGGEVIDA